jgi:hypothetical protein
MKPESRYKGESGFDQRAYIPASFIDEAINSQLSAFSLLTGMNPSAESRTLIVNCFHQKTPVF